jgi:D-serine deaminase-like pyridoxal phosphate-dependent protein
VILEFALQAAAGLITPVAVVDEIAMEANLSRMAAIAGGAGVRLRPHGKTHKSPHVAQRQLAHGAVGLTAATLTEAEGFAAAGVTDLVLAHPPVGAHKLRRLASLAERVRGLAVSLDSVEVAAALPAGVEVLWEVDTGLHRVGTPPGRPTADCVHELVEAIGTSRFRGLLTHGGHAYGARDGEERARAAREEAAGLESTAALLASEGVAVRELSVGSTPTADLLPAASTVTEMRPGTYVFGDANQAALGSMHLTDAALGVVATVVSTPEAGRAVIDAGSKALSNDLRVSGLEGFGKVLGRDDLMVARLSEEHAVLTSTGATGLRVGDRVVIIPAHACTTVNLHPGLLFYGAGRAWWEAGSMRGWGE